MADFDGERNSDTNTNRLVHLRTLPEAVGKAEQKRRGNWVQHHQTKMAEVLFQ